MLTLFNVICIKPRILHLGDRIIQYKLISVCYIIGHMCKYTLLDKRSIRNVFVYEYVISLGAGADIWL